MPPYITSVPPPTPMDTWYTCTLCNTDFNKRSTLERHMKNMHDSFKQKVKGDKRKNMFLSTKKKKTKLSCTVCNKAFDKERDLERHFKNVHENSFIRNYFN